MTTPDDRATPRTGPSAAIRNGSGAPGAVLVLTAALLFAVNGSVSKAAMTDGGISPVHLVTLRIMLAAVVFAVVAALRDLSALRIGRRELAAVAAHAIVGVAMVQWLYFVAIARMPVSVTLLIEFTAPLLIALWVRFVRRHPVRGRIWLALALILGGLALVARVWHGLTLDGVGLVAAVVAAFSLAVFYLLGEHGVGQRDPWAMAAWSFGIAALFWAVTGSPWTFPFDRLATPITLTGIGATGPAWLYLVCIVVVGTVAPFGLSLMGLRRIGAARAGLLATAEPPLAGLIAWPLLAETLLPVQLAGGLVVMIGIVLAESARAGQGATAPGVMRSPRPRSTLER